MTNCAPGSIQTYFQTSLTYICTIDKSQFPVCRATWMNMSTHVNLMSNLNIWLFITLWKAGHSSVFCMAAVMRPNWIVRAVNHPWLSSQTANIVQEDRSSSSTKVGWGPSSSTYNDNVLLYNNDIVLLYIALQWWLYSDGCWGVGVSRN